MFTFSPGALKTLCVVCMVGAAAWVVNQAPAGSPQPRIAIPRAAHDFGEVWLAEDTKLEGRRVALKLIPEEIGKSDRALKSLRREAEAALPLAHPNIVERRFAQIGFEVHDRPDGVQAGHGHFQGFLLFQSHHRLKPEAS